MKNYESRLFHDFDFGQAAMGILKTGLWALQSANTTIQCKGAFKLNGKVIIGRGQSLLFQVDSFRELCD